MGPGHIIFLFYKCAFINCGYLYTIQAYSVQKVKQYLLGGMPVIVKWIVNSEGHSYRYR